MKWNVIPVFWVVFLLASWSCRAQQVEVSGQVKGFGPGALVRVQVYADQFSQLEKTLVSARTDKNGNFHFTFPVKETTYALLAINLKKTGFYLKPGAVYHFQISCDSLARNSSPLAEIPLQVQLRTEDDSLNALIGVYDAMYSSLIDKHFRDIFMFHNRQVLDNFEKKVKQRFASVTLPYVRQYIRYSLASLAWGARTQTLPEIVQSCFAGHPVLYHNIQYTRFFLDFFGAYFNSTIKKPVTPDKLSQVIPQRSLKKLDELFALAPALQGDARVRQLAEMVQLAGLYHRPGFDDTDVAALFRQMATGSRFPENRQVAADYLMKLSRLQPGTPAPDFLLPDVMGKEYSLKDFHGKFVLLSFVNTRCPVCNYQLDLLQKMAKNLEDFTNVTIVKGKVTPEFFQKADPTGRSWPFLLLGNDILLLEKYQIVTYPAYVLIDPQGRILLAPAPMPDENLQQRIRVVINAFKKKYKIE